MESGVRNLEREIASVIRKVAREAVRKGFRPVEENTAEKPTDGKNGDEPEAEAVPFSTTITVKKIEKYLGQKKFQDDLVYRDSRAGLAHGLAWTETGGTLLPIEVAIIEGGGDLILTGSLGDVMKESARTAQSFIRAHYRKFALNPNFQKGVDVHIHVPEGAIPKDGPSAGITIAAALLSAFTGTPVAPGFAMTGEITLTGRLLAIGGVKEKVLAAHRNKMLRVLMPEANRKDIVELPREVKSQMEFVFADSALDALLQLFPEPFHSRAN
jgi:ATP-dependent Lon protease